MTARLVAVFVFMLAAGPAFGGDEPAAKTWALKVSSEKEIGKLPLTGTVPNNWDRPEVRSGYLTTKKQLADLWKALDQTDPLPEVDFDKQAVVVIELRAIRIKVEAQDGSPTLSFAISPPKAGVKERHFTLATFSKEEIDALSKVTKKK